MLNRLRMELLSLVLRLAAPPAYSRELYWERRATWRSCCIVMIDLGTGNNNKVNWAMEDKQELMDIRDGVPLSIEGSRSCRVPSRLLDTAEVLDEV